MIALKLLCDLNHLNHIGSCPASFMSSVEWTIIVINESLDPILSNDLNETELKKTELLH